MNQKAICQLFLSSLVLITVLCTYSSAAELNFVARSDKENVQIDLKIDKAEKMAGMKMVLSYNQKAIQFVEAKKSKQTQPFLHVINDKNPNKLIIVMASARGITGQDIALLHMTFKKTAAENEAPFLKVTQIQLMSEDLKEIKANLPKINP